MTKDLWSRNWACSPRSRSRIDLRIINRDPQGRPGTMIWRVIEAGETDSGRIFREGRLEVAAGEHPSWETLELSPLSEAEGRFLALQLIAQVEPERALAHRRDEDQPLPGRTALDQRRTDVAGPEY